MWSLHSEHATQYKFQFHRTKYSILPAISLDGILHLEAIEKAITSADFHCFVQGLLPHMNKWPLPNSVLVVDNASIHKVASICEMVEEQGACLLFLPAYTPDFNPIKLAFSTIKAWLCANRDRMAVEMDSEDGMVYNALWQAVHSVMAEDAKGWYKHYGYTIPTQILLLFFCLL